MRGRLYEQMMRDRERERQRTTCSEAGCKSPPSIFFDDCDGCQKRFCFKHRTTINWIIDEKYCRECLPQCEEPGCQAQPSHRCGNCRKFICPAHEHPNPVRSRALAVCKACKDWHDEEEQSKAETFITGKCKCGDSHSYRSNTFPQRCTYCSTLLCDICAESCDNCSRPMCEDCAIYGNGEALCRQCANQIHLSELDTDLY